MLLAIAMSTMELVFTFPQKDKSGPQVPGAETWWMHLPSALWGWHLLEPLRWSACDILTHWLNKSHPTISLTSGWFTIAVRLIFDPQFWVAVFVVFVCAGAWSTIIRHGLAWLFRKNLKAPNRRVFWFRQGWHIAIITIGLILLLLDGANSVKHAPLLFLYGESA